MLDAVRKRISRMIRRMEALPLAQQPAPIMDGSGAKAQRFGKIISASTDFTQAARWSYTVTELKWNASTQSWTTLGSLFGVRNLREWYNQQPVPAAPFYCGNGIRIENRLLSFTPTPFWVGGLAGVDNSRYRLQPASVGTPIVPIYLIGAFYWFEFDNGMDKLIQGCIA